MSPSSPHPRPGDRSAADHRAARSFARVPEVYHRGRPDYPAEAVRWLIRQPRQQVVELGAGTGKLTEVLLSAGHKVFAHDPAPELLGLLREHSPRAVVATARAEQVPVVTRSADVVAAAQAFHWFDAEKALREAARVLRVGGVLGLVWNTRDERVPWVRRLGELIGEVPADRADPVPAIDDSGLFETVEQRSFRHWQPITKQTLRALVSSRSNVITRDRGERDDLLAAVDEVYDDLTRGASQPQIPYLTTVYRTVVLPWAVEA